MWQKTVYLAVLIFFFAAISQAGTYTVIRVIDGDTIDVAVPTKNGEAKLERVRFIGVDTPELAIFGKPAECYAQEAKTQVKGMIEGKKVRVVRCTKCGKRGKDRFGRTLAYVYYLGPDSKMYGPATAKHSLSQWLLRNGYARYMSEYPPDQKYRAAYIAAERFAKGEIHWPDDASITANGAPQGIWQQCEGKD